MGRMIFVNLAVEDLDRAVAFFTKLGFSFDATFTDDTATMMVVNDKAYVMLLERARFQEFTPKALADPRTATEVLVGLSADSREDVDLLVDTALGAGAEPHGEPTDAEGMYGRSFSDLDGHVWEVMWMDLDAVAS